MRSNSGRDESETNLRDPTVRDRQNARQNADRSAASAKAPADQRQGRKD